MPVWYTGVLDEHNAVRKAAGLFDVSHMGVFEACGPHAEAFLDLVVSNYVRWYAPGESFYSYLLDVDGNVIDDLLIYRRAKDRFLIVVNASNADKDWAWLNAVNNGEVLLDRERPDVRVLRPPRCATSRTAPPAQTCASTSRCRARLPWPSCRSMADDPRLVDALGRLRKTGVMECELDGLRPGDRPHRLHGRRRGLRAVCPPGPRGRRSGRRCLKRANRSASSRGPRLA
jgi:hypothetical protein